MFKRNLTSDAFDDISFDKKEIPGPPQINFSKKHELMFRYGLITLCGLFLFVFLLEALIYFDCKDDIKSISREHELYKNEIHLIKKELRNALLAKQHDEVLDGVPPPVISYRGTIRAKGEVKALIELSGARQLVLLGHQFEAGWRLTELLDGYLILKSQSGRSIQVNREEPAS
jgi:hypothetical protein